MAKDALTAQNLVQTAHVVGLRFSELFAGMDLTPTQFAVLIELERLDDGEEGLTQAELARRVLVRPQSVGVLLTSLVEQGLVTRTGPGGRGRRVGIALTEAGRAALERAWPPVRAFNTPAALGLTPAQAGMLDELLEHVRRALRADD
ncbi:MarR family winged helix-turn-helix transcriptional regulator [Actinomycetospora straminea]|uniref:HTH marR-type domain-containing protein n=1 Tax=Actinomycetospora straminea TaxID=663607 RepID=A0ABP9EJR0_9PSEU|nr:MarR family transcriptional regulator [Actinomycetospora straminea]MDD7933260.1 MarR family transcriptional regulator [Actinomycetospora straminea]